MILINYFEDEIKEIKQRFFQRIKHPYMNKFIIEPVLDDDRLFLLYSMLSEKKLEKECINTYIITTLLVQAALDTHETISIGKLSSEKDIKERQLTVLAGDYYSSLYYYLLAKMNDISMIRVLANSIQEINECKMNIYKKNHQNISKYIEDIKIIDSSLMQRIAEHFNLQKWQSITSEFFFLKRIISERGEFLNGHKAPLIDVILNDKKTKELPGESGVKCSLDLCDNYIFQTRLKLTELCKQPSPLNSFVIERINQMVLEAGLLKEKVAEEG
ncbi:hypothetical protein BKP37_07525 [Anaerobacillus alkalilacustris]|uniref:Heptaprenyl diphosphate synthase n=1 Tax=Anaerobacillus alkalilacustris TaxID=393763 RepID=A0A1S2LQN3_9BACI|nr:heptaprenyl diphosphate synthase component 1 [Anaerobacillus alkalilacustris]OIJ14818.1 hypothetical protein BKP37_07525 [Anaerobacillus alkalilacustris]